MIQINEMNKYFRDKEHSYQAKVTAIVKRGTKLIKNGDQFKLLDKLMYLMVENAESDVLHENLNQIF